jgi:hypothetical protein
MNDAFNPSYCHPSKPVTRQLNEGIEFHLKRYRRADKYLAYFQAYSNTYAPLENLEKNFSEALAHPQVIGLVIGTRPDCIDDEKLLYLQKLSRKHYILVEYGLESCYDKTLEKINRGHTFGQSVEALEKTAASGLRSGAHIIFGLPGESRDEMLAEADILSHLPIHTLKFHQLQLIKGTKMAELYNKNSADFNLFSLDDYIEFITLFIGRLNPDIIIERFTGEVPPRFLAGPNWGLIRNDQVIRKMEKNLEEKNTWQGKHFSANPI